MFIGNLAFTVTDEALEAVFSEYDAIDITVVKNMTGRSRGFAVAKFRDDASGTTSLLLPVVKLT